MRFAHVRIVVLTLTFFNVLPMAFAQEKALISQTATQSIEGHQLIVTVLSKGSKAQVDSASWWTWGNTADSTYMFALDRPNNVRFALIFAAGKPGRQATLVYARKDQPPMPIQQSGELITLGDISVYPHLVITTPSSDWIINGQANYQLKLVGDGVAGLESITSIPDGTPDFIREVTPDAAGFPARDETRVVQNPFPNRGYPRYGLNQRVGMGAPFQTWPALIPGFPYLGVGQRRADWFTSNPNPIYFNVSSGEIQFFPFTGFQTAGMYGINSLKLDKIDFENVFALYSLRSAPPYADLVVRSKSFPAGDAFGPKPNISPRSTFRYSWKTTDSRLWAYSLAFAGEDLIVGDDTSISKIKQNYDILPKKVINASWKAISFVQAMNGYPGSEGIYHYTAQDDRVWPSLQPNPPKEFVLSQPLFQTDDGLRADGGKTLPLNFRGEYLFGTPRKAVLYRSDLDGLVHLFGAREGFWYTAKQQFLRTSDLDTDGYVDSYQECSLLNPVQLQADSSTAPTSCNIQLIRLANSSVLIDNDHISVKSRLTNPLNLPVTIPTESMSWKTFMNQARGSNVMSGHIIDLWNSLPGKDTLLSTQGVIDIVFDKKIGHLNLSLKTVPGQKNRLIILSDGSSIFK